MILEWKKRAQTELVKDVKYCKKTFGERVAKKFLDSIDYQVNLLAKYPNLGAIEPLLEDRLKPFRSFVVHEHFKLIYYVDKQKEIIHIVDIWDTRREPQKLSSRISSKKR